MVPLSLPLGGILLFRFKFRQLFGLNFIDKFCAPASADERVLTVGWGTFTCAQFAQDYKRDVAVEQIYFTWAQGYMSGLNAGDEITKNVSKNLLSKPPKEQKFQIREYCDTHPLAKYSEAIVDVWASMALNPPRK